MSRRANHQGIGQAAVVASRRSSTARTAATSSGVIPSAAQTLDVKARNLTLPTRTTSNGSSPRFLRSYVVFGDIFRSPDLSGWAKALWTIFVIIVPYLGVFVYLIARGGKMQEHGRQAAAQQDAAMRQYIQSVATTDGGSSADEIARLAQLRDQGVLSEAEFQQAKAKALA